MGHIELARWADAIVIAPATANTMAKLAIGMADNLLTTVVLASKADLSDCSSNEPANVGAPCNSRKRH